MQMCNFASMKEGGRVGEQGLLYWGGGNISDYQEKHPCLTFCPLRVHGRNMLISTYKREHSD